MSTILSAVKQHFASTLRSCNQPHTFDLHLMFLRSATAGEAEVRIKDIKLGVNVSIVHVTLIQKERERVVGYAS